MDLGTNGLSWATVHLNIKGRGYMDVYGLKQHIINNPESIELILEKTGFYFVTERGDEFRCAREEGRNPTSVKVNKNTLAATCFSTNLKGDIILLVQSKLNISFPKTIKTIADIINFKETTPVEKPIMPFGGYYKKISRLRSDDDIDLETYSDDILLRFESTPNLLFYEDGILPTVQEQFHIGYDSVSCRITVPWLSFDGYICGIMGRLNKKLIRDDESKWFPIIPFPKSKTLYGFVENYSSMQEKSIVMIGESEKHTLQLASKGINVGVSLGGSSMSEVQTNHIKSLFPDKIIVMMDEGLEREHSHEIAAKLKSDKYYKNNVGYIFDKENMYLPKDSKMAPADLDRDTLNKLIKNCTIWL
jgi:DNA primase